jgi:hypothetical protein
MLFVALFTGPGQAVAALSSGAARELLREHCADCHDAEAEKGGLNLMAVLGEDIARQPEVWEKVLRRLDTRQMPPASRRSRPTEAEYESMAGILTRSLDAAAAAQPRPGRTETIRRLNRTEYQNAIRDLLGLEIDAASLLPADEASHGFDNVTVGTLSPVLLDRYITAAQKIARLAVGGEQRVPGGDTIRIKPDITQEDRVEGLPFGTRGGALIPHTFPRDGEYEITIRLARDRNDNVEGLNERHELLVLVDRREMQAFTVRPPPREQGHNDVDKHLTVRLPVKAGPRELGVTFVKSPASLLEYQRQPYESRFNFHRHPRIGPAVYQVSIVGPFDATGPGDTPSRRLIFTARPKAAADEPACAREIISALMRRAYRRPVAEIDVARVLPFYEQARAEGGSFDAGIEAALSAILVSREFLFRIEREPKGLEPGQPYRVNDLELASRLSFFLWSSIPDGELLALAERGELGKPAVLEAQTRRLLADPRAGALVSNFAGQWLHLRNLESATPDGRLFPDFDDNLRQAMRRETELLFGEILRADRSVLDLLKPDHTWLNERLAKHYGVPHVYGPHFRPVSLRPEDRRGGLLRHASVLTVTSYATRTSPVIRGKWILETLIGTPPPPPEPDVPALDESSVSENLPVRERLAAHRNKPACASCHEFIDPPGFALENFDAVGRWRELEAGRPVDASGGLPDGRRFVGVAGLEQGLLARPDVLTRTLTEKLLTFALGRGIEPYDGPAVRAVVRRAAANDYRLSEIVLGIVNSAPFRMREGTGGGG